MSKKILIAEDENEILDMLADMLETAGFEVIKAENGKEALKEFDQEAPDLFLLDLQMPEVDGFAVLEELRSDGRILKTRVVILSNLDKPDLIKRAKELGVYEYWKKVDTHLTELVTKVKDLLNE